MEANDLFKLTQQEDVLKDRNTGHLLINVNKIVSKNLVKGLRIKAEETMDGVNIEMIVEKPIENLVHLCFGVTHEKALQKINMDVEVRRDTRISVLSHCIFPRAVDVKHVMDARIKVGERATYRYMEKHIHSETGGIEVYPKAVVELDRGARFYTEFELLRGRVGKLEINYEVTGGVESVTEMTSRVSGRGDDVIKIRESSNLIGRKARGVLTSRVAVRDSAKAAVYNRIIATAPYTRGHVDCKEIIQDNGSATAIPIVEVRHPKAHVTHEAAIGSVDTKQLETLMSRGLSEDEAVEVIIEGLLS